MFELSPVSHLRGALRRAGWAVVTGLVAAVLTAPALADANPQPADCTLTVPEPWYAVRYTEWPEGGPSRAHGRPLPQSSRPTYGIDINSWVRIDIDAGALWCQVKDQLTIASEPTPQAMRMRRRLEQLIEAQGSLGEALSPPPYGFGGHPSGRIRSSRRGGVHDVRKQASWGEGRLAGRSAGSP